MAAALSLSWAAPLAAASFGDLTPVELGSGDYEAGTGADIRAAGMTTGPDGAVWFTEFGANQIGRLASDGTVSTFPISSFGQPFDIVTGPDGNLWFTHDSGNEVGRITPTGTITTFPLAGPDHRTTHIAVGADDKIWWANLDGNSLGRIDPGAADPGTTTTFFDLPNADSSPLDIVEGADHLLWFTEQGGRIGHLDPLAADPAASLVEIPVESGFSPSNLTVGPDSAIWFTEHDGSDHEKLVRIAADGTITAQFDVSAAGGGPSGLVTGPDGNLWFGDYYNDSVNRVTTAGVLTRLPLPETEHDGAEPSELLTTADGRLLVSTTHKLFFVDTTPEPDTPEGPTTTTPGGPGTTAGVPTTLLPATTGASDSPVAVAVGDTPTYTG